MTAIVPFEALAARALDVERLTGIAGGGRSPQTLRAYSNDMQSFTARPLPELEDRPLPPRYASGFAEQRQQA